jgi:hypothetical protein
MICSICGAVTHKAFSATVLGKYVAEFHCCGECGFLFAKEPHWLDEAYSSAIAAADTGLVCRNIQVADKLAGVLYWVAKSHGRGRYLDAAGGYGMLTRLMRDSGFDFYWSDKHCQNLLATQFQYVPSLGSCDAVTAIEVMEHLQDPVGFVDQTLKMAGSEMLIFTTELYEGTVPRPEDWWYYTFATGQHIGFFKRQTLEAIGSRLGLQYCSANGLHVLSRQAMDQQRLRWATGRWAAQIGARWIRRRLGSKTLGDHEAILRMVDPNPGAERPLQ